MADIYWMWYEVEIQFVAPGDVWWGCPVELCFETRMGEPTLFTQQYYQGKKKAEPGDVETVRGSLMFRRTENGWRGPDGETY